MINCSINNKGDILVTWKYSRKLKMRVITMLDAKGQEVIINIPSKHPFAKRFKEKRKIYRCGYESGRSDFTDVKPITSFNITVIGHVKAWLYAMSMISNQTVCFRFYDENELSYAQVSLETYGCQHEILDVLEDHDDYTWYDWNQEAK